MAKQLSQKNPHAMPAMVVASLVAMILVLPGLCLAQTDAEAEASGPPAEAAPANASAPDSGENAKDADPDSETAAVDACDAKRQGEPFQEQTRETFRSWSCHSFRWFDGLWGDSHDFEEEAVRGWFIAGAEYTQYDDFDPRLRVRVRAPLPNMNERWDLILGRVDETSYVSDTEVEDKEFFNPGAVSQRDEEPEWLLGLGHKGRSRRSGWDWDAGVRLRAPPEPYVKLQYYFNRQFGVDTDFNYRQTFFWRSDDGLGTTGRGDFTHRLGPSNVLRTEAIATHSEITLGTQWYLGQTWYHRIEGENGVSLLAFVSGETDHPVPLREYGLNLIWRRPFTRDWLYLSLGPSVTWPKEFVYEDRDLSLGFGAWIEVEFGDWRY